VDKEQEGGPPGALQGLHWEQTVHRTIRQKFLFNFSAGYFVSPWSLSLLSTELSHSGQGCYFLLLEVKVVLTKENYLFEF
jgi:hypothetical protein